MKLNRGFGPVTVSRWPSKSTVVSSAPRRSTAFAGLVGVTVTTVSVRSPGDDLDGAHRQVDGDVDRGGRGVRGHGDACLPLGVFVRPRGFAWLVGLWGWVV